MSPVVNKAIPVSLVAKQIISLWNKGVFSCQIRTRQVNYGKIPQLRTVAIFATVALSLTACASAPVVTATPSSCASLLPPQWKEGVAGADLPAGNTVGDWVVFGEQQTGRLEIANDRTISAIGIVERCEKRDAEAIKRASRGFWGRLFS